MIKYKKLSTVVSPFILQNSTERFYCFHVDLNLYCTSGAKTHVAVYLNLPLNFYNIKPVFCLGTY